MGLAKKTPTKKGKLAFSVACLQHLGVRPRVCPAEKAPTIPPVLALDQALGTLIFLESGLWINF
jgi:hypothetical protein